MYRVNAILIAAVLAFTFGMPCALMAEESTESEETVMENIPAGLVLQDLDYTEDPVDIPNPDRGFYRANDGMVVPVTGTGEEERRWRSVRRRLRLAALR